MIKSDCALRSAASRRWRATLLAQLAGAVFAILIGACAAAGTVDPVVLSDVVSFSSGAGELTRGAEPQVSVESPVFARIQRWFGALWRPQDWDQASINRTLLDPSATEQLSLVAALGFMFAVAVALLIASGRRRATSAAMLGTLAGMWLLLDTAWMFQLLHRASGTADDFLGAGPREKLAASIDGPVAAVIEEVKPLIPSRARVFVATALDFQGMRAAYYLYPRNVYWQRYGPELPPAGRLRFGDYVLLIVPVETRLEGGGTLLLLSNGDRVPVELIWSSGAEALVRVSA